MIVVIVANAIAMASPAAIGIMASVAAMAAIVRDAGPAPRPPTSPIVRLATAVPAAAKAAPVPRVALSAPRESVLPPLHYPGPSACDRAVHTAKRR